MNVRICTRSARGFTLLEFIGIVALIAILATVLGPRVTSMIGRGRVKATVQGLAGLKTATLDYVAANGTIPVRNGTGRTDEAQIDGRFDADLVAGGYVEKLFTSRLGWQVTDSHEPLTVRSHVRSLKAIVSRKVARPGPSNGGSNFDIDRDDTTADFTSSNTIVSAFIPGVRLAEAIALNKEVDGDLNSPSTADVVGRCIYSAPDKDNRVSVYIYIAHY